MCQVPVWCFMLLGMHSEKRTLYRMLSREGAHVSWRSRGVECRGGEECRDGEVGAEERHSGSVWMGMGCRRTWTGEICNMGLSGQVKNKFKHLKCSGARKEDRSTEILWRVGICLVYPNPGPIPAPCGTLNIVGCSLEGPQKLGCGP